MFAIVALLCLYLGGNNIKKAFVLAPFGRWKAINWMLLGTGVALLALVPFLIRQAMKDYQIAKENAAEKERQAEAKKKALYSYDDEENFDDE